jgi:hypothetical protein
MQGEEEQRRKCGWAKHKRALLAPCAFGGNEQGVVSLYSNPYVTGDVCC